MLGVRNVGDKFVDHFGHAADERLLHEIDGLVVKHPSLDRIEPVGGNDEDLVCHGLGAFGLGGRKTGSNGQQ